MTNPKTKKILKWTGIALFSPLALIALLALLLYLPPIQNWAVHRVASYASQQTGMDISVDNVRLAFPLDLQVNGVMVTQKGASLKQPADTLADIKGIRVDVQMWPLLRSQVMIDQLQLQQVKMNTLQMVKEARVKGHVGLLELQSHGIDLKREWLRLDNALLSDAQVTVELSDTVPPDTSKTQNKWRIEADRLVLRNTQVTVITPGDSTRIMARMDKTEVTRAKLQLLEGRYEVARMAWNGGALAYNNMMVPRAPKGLDPNHISLQGVRLTVDSLLYCSQLLKMDIRQLAMKERCGLDIRHMQTRLLMDSAAIHLPQLLLRTPCSSIKAGLDMQMNTFSDRNPGVMALTMDAALGKRDILLMAGGMVPETVAKGWPAQPLTLKAVAKGNMRRMEIAGLSIVLPGALRISAKGSVGNITDMESLQADIYMRATAWDIGFLTAMAGTGGLGVNIPKGITMAGSMKAWPGMRYNADMTITEGGSKVRAKANFNAKSMAYSADIKASNVNVSHFVKGGMTAFTGNLHIKGRGTDPWSSKTQMAARADIGKLLMDRYDIGNVKAEASLKQGRMWASIDSDNPLMKGVVALNALMQKRSIDATLTTDLQYADLHALHLTDNPLKVGLCCHVDVSSDLKDIYKVQGLASNMTVVTKDKTYRPMDVVMDVMTDRDTTWAVVDCGDFHLSMDARGGYKRLMNEANGFMNELKRQLDEHRLNKDLLARQLPSARLHLDTGGDNVFSNALKHLGYKFKIAEMDMAAAPANGLNGYLHITELQADSVRLDTIRFDIKSDSTQWVYRGQVRNSRSNPQHVFNALFNGYIFENGSGINMSLFDDRDRLGIKLGLEAMIEQDGMRVRLLSDDPIIGYKRFNVNPDNYLFMGNDRRISARLQITADDGTGVQVYTDDDNLEALQDITVSMNNFDLAKVLTLLPYMPRITGKMNGDVHVIETPEQMSVSSTLSVDKMTYEGSPMGDVSAEFVYMPKAGGAHYVDALLFSNDREVGRLEGQYDSRSDVIDAEMTMSQLPMELANGFIPEQIVGFRGMADGKLSIKGRLSQPQVDGEVFLDSTYMVSVPYGVELRFSNDPVRIVGSHLLLENFEMYAFNNNPVNIYGGIDFSDPSHITMDVRMKADNCQIINAKENMRSVAYGKVFVNFIGAVNGALSDLRMRGRLDVLGTTDMSYILRDSPLTTDNQMDELVKFTSFNDSTVDVVKRPPLEGFDMDLTMNVDQGAHVMCYLNQDHSNYIDLMGGGKLRMQYNPVDNLLLTGRYTLLGGEMKYSLPVIPLKTFTIQDGSYIEFTGNPMNPRLNITATERTKATVGTGDGAGRPVNFDCGVVITKTLSDMGLEFTLDAPEDMSLHTELASMSLEQRGKLAVTMLTTGMYLADGNTGSFSMNSALSSFLQGKINDITGSALRTLDLSIGLDNATDASGNMHTDYSFKFAKRFWNNRLRIVVGGKVSTGPEVKDQDKSFFDNVIFEYRLDNSANKNVTLFYDNSSYDWLEGTTAEYGVGFTWKRNLQHFKDIFSLRKEKQPTYAMPLKKDDENENKEKTNEENKQE